MLDTCISYRRPTALLHTSVMRLDGGDVLHRGDDESCISADDLTAAAVVGGEPAADIFNQTYTASYFSRTVRATFATAALLFHFTDLHAATWSLTYLHIPQYSSRTNLTRRRTLRTSPQVSSPLERCPVNAAASAPMETSTCRRPVGRPIVAAT